MSEHNSSRGSGAFWQNQWRESQMASRVGSFFRLVSVENDTHDPFPEHHPQSRSNGGQRFH